MSKPYEEPDTIKFLLRQLAKKCKELESSLLHKDHLYDQIQDITALRSLLDNIQKRSYDIVYNDRKKVKGHNFRLCQDNYSLIECCWCGFRILHPKGGDAILLETPDENFDCPLPHIIS